MDDQQPARPPRRNSKSGRKREQIRRAAYQCFRETGYHDTTVDAICKRIGISKGSFYWHYNAKQDVFIDILETWAREVMDELYEQFEDAMSQDDYIGPLTWALEREIHRGRVLVPLWLEFSVHARREKEIQEKLSKFYRRARSAITEILRPALEHRFSEKEMQSISATIFGAYTGLMIQDLSDPERADAREMVQNFMGVIEWWLRQVDEGATPKRTQRTASIGARIKDQDLDDYLSNTQSNIAELVHKVRTLVLHSAPEADERIIQGWKVIAYERGGLVAFIKARPGDVLLGFYQGAALPDPVNVLEGKGKQRRHLKLAPGQPINRVVIKDLIEAAVTFQRI